MVRTRPHTAEGKGNQMDLYATFPCSVQAVFACVADPSRLGDWLPQVITAVEGTGSPGGTWPEFRVTVRVDGAEVAASGEVTAFEPPWLVSFRLITGAQIANIRVTCTAQPGGTRIHLHQPDSAVPLTIDLARLTRALATQQAH